MSLRLYNADMFGVFGKIDTKSIDLLLTDFPYGTLNKRNEWDVIIDYEKFWNHIDKICKTNASIISTAQQPFTTKLISTNYSMFRYCWVWEKSKATGYLNSKKIPLKAHEDIVVFYKKLGSYNPQMTQGTPYDKGTAVRDTESYGKQTRSVHVKNENGMRFPRSVIYFKTAEGEGKLHPTQKPVALMEYLIKTYSNENDIVLDPCMGSGTTGIACMNTNRKFMGIEKDPVYFQKAYERMFEHQKNSLDFLKQDIYINP